MSIYAESLLATTGLTVEVDRTAIIAARTHYRDLEKSFLAVLDREGDPKKLLVNDRKPSYMEKLSMRTVGPKEFQLIDRMVDLKTAGEYQTLHQNAKAMMTARYPKQSVSTPTREVECPPDPELMAQWLLEVEYIENGRLVPDMLAGGLLPECIEVFATVFPETYMSLVVALNAEISKRGPKWLAELWLETVLQVFLKVPIESGPSVDPAPPEAPPSKMQVSTKALQTATTALPE